jgi:cephalosporin-C deacetylase-like acetyl esterase
MKYLSIITLVLTIFFMSCSNGHVKTSNGGLEITEPSITIDDPKMVNGLEVVNFNRRRVIQLNERANEGVAEDNFLGESAKYDIAVYYVSESKGKSNLELIINDQVISTIQFYDASKNSKAGSLNKKEIPKINVQQYSSIRLRFHGDSISKCRIEKVVFILRGPFEKKTLDLVKLKTLKIFETSTEQIRGRNMLTDFVKIHLDSVMKERMADLASLKTPDEWMARQGKIRKMLPELFGEFPKKTSLNARIVGKIEHKHYTIEKIIYESQPKYYVTANLYLPKDRKFPVPGIVFPCGHSDDAKARDFYHETGLGFVLKGYVVLVIDPMGQGERSEYINSVTGESLVHKGVNQHYYIGRPSFLINWTLSGLRTWDCIRAVDYLVSRPEVDTSKLAAVGCSGGGQMSLLVTAFDKRIKVCAASHPGGEMENTYLTGQTKTDRDILSLIPPRPLRIIVGDSSGEESDHRAKLNDMQLFYEGLWFKKDREELVIVSGVHSMNIYNREAAYEWVNKWFDKEKEGKTESVLQPEEIKDLWCTKSGSTLISLGGETGQTLNAKRLQHVYRYNNNSQDLKKRIAQRIKLEISSDRNVPKSKIIETVSYGDLSIEKLTYESETGIAIPSLLIKPKNIKSGSPVFLYASDKGKPGSFGDTLMPFKLAIDGFIVLAIDVRGTGEISPTASLPLTTDYSRYALMGTQWAHDALAIQSAAFGRTIAGMRVFDMIRGIDFIKSRDDLKGRNVVTVGQGLGGLWASLTSIFDSRVNGLVTIGTLPSYIPLITSQYYNINSGYFWLPGALADFDILDLMRLVSPKPDIWIDPVNALGEKLDSISASSMIKPYKNLQIITTDKSPVTDILKLFEKKF